MAAALSRHQDIFTPFYIAMIRVGEMTGRLTEVFLRLNEHLEFEQDVRARIKQAVRYPVFVMIAMAVAIVILNLFVIRFCQGVRWIQRPAAAHHPRFCSRFRRG